MNGKDRLLLDNYTVRGYEPTLIDLHSITGCDSLPLYGWVESVFSRAIPSFDQLDHDQWQAETARLMREFDDAWRQLAR
jgi:hypothetical protein